MRTAGTQRAEQQSPAQHGEQPQPQPPPEKRMRSGNESQVEKSKQEQEPMRQSASGATDSIRVNLTGEKYAQTQWYNGKKLLNIRKWYTDKTSGELRPTKQGIVLNPEQWLNLASKAEQITKTFDDEEDDLSAFGKVGLSTPCDIGGNKKVSVQPYNNVPLLQIREYYEDQSGEWKPTKKGVTLTYVQWLRLEGQTSEISRIMKIETQTQTGAAAEAEAEAERGRTERAAPPAQAQAPPPVAAEGTSTAGPMRSSGAGVRVSGVCAEPTTKREESRTQTQQKALEEVQLSQMRILKVRTWKASKLADFREYYHGKGDQGLLPGKKGISLSVKQWSCLFDHVQEIDDALQSSNTGYLLPLDNSPKRVTISNYKGGLYVDIREWYNSGDTWKPGRKGISLSKDQWSQVFLNAPSVHLAMHS